MSILLVSLTTVGLALLVTGAIIQFRNRSPYSGTRMDRTAMRRFGAGAWIGALGALCILVAQIVTFWP